MNYGGDLGIHRRMVVGMFTLLMGFRRWGQEEEKGGVIT